MRCVLLSEHDWRNHKQRGEWPSGSVQDSSYSYLPIHTCLFTDRPRSVWNFAFASMAWGKPQSSSPTETASELIAKAHNTGSLVVLPMRTFGGQEMVALCDMLASNTTITELKASGKPIGAEGARAIGTLLASTDCSLRRLAVGDTNFGNEGGLHEMRVMLQNSQCSPMLWT